MIFTAEHWRCGRRDTKRVGTQPKGSKERRKGGRTRKGDKTRQDKKRRGNTQKCNRKYTTHHGNVGLGSVLEPGEELSRSAGHLLVRLSLVPERVEVGVVLFLHGVERDGGILLLQLAHASASGGEEEEGVFSGGGVGRLGERASVWTIRTIHSPTNQVHHKQSTAPTF